MKQHISNPARARLVSLARLLEDLEHDGISVITSAEIEKRTGWTSFTVRRDISLLAVSCAGPAGYSVAALKDAISGALGIRSAGRKCCIVGLGRMGAALIGFEGFSRSSFTIAAGFDSNVNKTEILRADFPLYSTNKMEEVIAREQIEFAILTVPEKAAQKTADRLVKSGIKGIVNYTAALLSVPPRVYLENLSIIDALQKLAAAAYIY